MDVLPGQVVMGNPAVVIADRAIFAGGDEFTPIHLQRRVAVP